MGTSKIEFTRVKNDTNGNPRYVCHFLNLATDKDLAIIDKMIVKEKIKNVFSYRIETEYKLALKRAKKIGGRKFHNKQYGGGIVFQSYNLQDTEKRILELLK
jgi:hypothetical protein